MVSPIVLGASGHRLCNRPMSLRLSGNYSTSTVSQTSLEFDRAATTENVRVKRVGNRRVARGRRALCWISWRVGSPLLSGILDVDVELELKNLQVPSATPVLKAP